ncbi:MAG: tetratricopeptide repeat protein, partial [Paludibacteraceae bacterium]
MMVRNVLILKMMNFKYAISIMLVCFPFLTFAQAEYDKIREGNKAYEEGDYQKSQSKYRDAQILNDNSYGAYYNMGNAYYKQGDYDKALEAYEKAEAKVPNGDKMDKSKVYHNMGNSYLQKKEYEKSVKYYKEALRYNPKSEDTRYNLAYAQRMLIQQQQQQQQQ